MQRTIIAVIVTVILTVLLGSPVMAAPHEQGGNTVHYVTLGDTLSSIATQYGVAAEAILRYNGISNPNLIYVGQGLIIPTQHFASPSYSYSHSCSRHYTVQHGDTLYSIARFYGVSASSLAQQNGLFNPNLVRVGQRLCIPGSAQSTTYHPPAPQIHTPPVNAYYHTVSKGETLFGICERYGVERQVVLEANHLSAHSYIHPGQKLYIPHYQPPVVVKHEPTPPTVIVVERVEVVKPEIKKEVIAPPPPVFEPIPVYLRLGRNVTYETWGRPDFGLDDCVVDWYDDGDPVLRFTTEVLLTNRSDLIIPSAWADTNSVIFHTLSGTQRFACKHVFNIDHTNESMSVTFADLKRLDTDSYPGDLQPGATVNVTFFTHLERGDLVTKLEFVEFGICIDPNSGDEIPCDFN